MSARRARGGSGPWLPRLLGGALAALVLGVNLAGAAYYLAPLAVRVRHDLHPWLRPSGYVGQSLGLLAAGLFFFLWLYPIRKAIGSRAPFAGSVGAWLDWHIAAGLIVPWAAATHAGWRFTGLIGLGYGALFVVFLSGLVGRYLYTRIPRRRDGVELTREELAAERERLLFEMTAATGWPPDRVREALSPDVASFQGLGLLGTLRRMVADDRDRRRAVASLRREAAGGSRGTRALRGADLERALAMARREIALAQQARMLDATHRVFRYWHAAHKPFAITALLAVLTHIVVAVAVGATWLG